jgi:predicted permease
VLLAARVFRGREDGALVAFFMFGNPTYWALPVATAVLGAHAAVFLVAYDMLTQPRISVGVRLMRGSAPHAQAPRTALTDYAPSVAAVVGLAFGAFVPAPEAIDTIVAVLGVAVATGKAQ